MSFYADLRAVTAGAREAFLAVPAVQRGLHGRIARASYVAFLAEAYHHVRHTVPLLMMCGARLPESLAWLRVAVADYIAEEIGHDAWILDDIAAAGGDAAAVQAGAPSAATELMVAYAYDTVQRGNPVGLFGMVFVLEGTSVALATRAADALQTALQLPAAAFTYLISHGALDRSHLATFEGLMNRLERAEDRQAVLHAADRFYLLYGNVFRSLPLDELPSRAIA